MNNLRVMMQDVIIFCGGLSMLNFLTFPEEVNNVFAIPILLVFFGSEFFLIDLKSHIKFLQEPTLHWPLLSIILGFTATSMFAGVVSRAYTAPLDDLYTTMFLVIILTVIQCAMCVMSFLKDRKKDGEIEES